MEHERQTVVKSIEDALASDDIETACEIMKAQSGLFSAQHPAPNRLLLRMIKDLHDNEQWDASVPLMQQLLQQSPSPQPTVRLKLAQILYQVCNRPSQALEVLDGLPQTLTDEQTKLRQQLAQLAKQALQKAG